MAESLYTTETPASETSESPGPTIGTVIKVTVAGHQVTKLKWFAPAESTGDDTNIPFVLYDADTQEELARKVVSITLGVWNTVTLDDPVPVSLNQRILPSVKTPTRYTFTAGFFALTDLVVGNLTAPATGNTIGGNGRFHTGGDAYPESTFGGNNYWTDVVLEEVPAGDEVDPDSLSLAVTFGSPTLAQTFTAAPTSLSLPVTLGSPAAAQTFTLTPISLAVPVAFGLPTLTQGAIAPDPLAVPVIFGAPTLAQTFTVAPDSLSLAVTLGAPTLATAFEGTVTPDSLSLPVSLGEPRVSFTPPATGSWEALLGIAAEARADHARNQERIANPIDCPIHGWPLERGPNETLHCKFGGHVVRRGS